MDVRAKIGIIISIFISNFCNVRSSGFLRQKILKIDRFIGICEGYEDVAMTLHNLSFTYTGKSIVINGKLLVKHDLVNQIEQVVSLTRCPHRDSLDSCEMYQNMKFARCCDLLNSRGQLWSNFVDSIHPQIRCPVKAGIYSIDDATFDVTFTLIPLDNWYWKLDLNSYDVKTKEHLLCLKVECQIVSVTNRY